MLQKKNIQQQINTISFAATSFGSTPTSNLDNLLGTATGSNGDIPYTECPYIAEDYSFLACFLWCDLRQLSLSETCTGNSDIMIEVLEVEH